MTWRRVPPVYSPIAPLSLAGAGGAALGITPVRRDALSARIGDTFNARETWLTDSGTSALLLALRCVAPEDGVVALPGYGCIDLIAAAIGARMRVALYDVDPETLSPDVDSVRAVLSRGACALVVAPLYGYPPDMPALRRAATDFGVPVVEDAAQGAGATLEDRRVGTFGDLTVLSFGRGKGTTAGSGGALLLRGLEDGQRIREARSQLAPPMRGMRDVVALAALWLLARPALYSAPSSIPALELGEMVYHPAKEPRALSNAAAAVLPFALAQDARELVARRQHAAALLAANDSSRRFTAVRALPGAVPGYLRLALLGGGDPPPVSVALGAVRGYAVTLDEHPETRRVLAGNQVPLPGSRVLRNGLVTLPTHSRVTDRDLARLAAWLGAGAGSVSVEQTKQAV